MSTINVTNLKGRGGASPTLPDGAVVTGVATATTFSGTLDGSLKTTGTPTLGLGVTINSSGINVSGVLTATTFKGDGSNLTGVGESIAPWHYNPDINDTLTTVGTGIGITFNKKVLAGSGTATLKIVNAGAAGTTIQSWGVNSCTFNVTQFSLGSLVSSLTINQTYQVDIPSGFIVDSSDTDYVGTAWTFTVQGADYKLWAVGRNDEGALGQNSPGPSARSSPIQIPGVIYTDSFGEGGGGFGGINLHQSAVKSDGTLWMWGNGGNGQLGQNDRASLSSPTQVPGTTWSIVSNSYYGTFGKKTDGTLWAWGFNTTGLLGTNSAANISSPTQIPGTTWAEIAGGFYHSLGLKTNGTLWAWGSNSQGVLGLNQAQPVQVSSPIQIPGTNWSTISCGWYTSLATKTDGTLWTWGNAAEGKLGHNQPVNSDLSSPTQIPGTSWSRADGGRNQTFALRTDGTLFAWGHAGNGGLGLNSSTVQRSSPTQIPGTTWSEIGSGSYEAHALKTDGSWWAWGSNTEGSLGQNNTVKYSSPVQVGSETDWIALSVTAHNAYAIQKDETP